MDENSEEYARRFGKSRDKVNRTDGRDPGAPHDPVSPLDSKYKEYLAAGPGGMTNAHVSETDSAHGRHYNDGLNAVGLMREVNETLVFLDEQVHIAEEALRGVVGATPYSDHAITAVEATLWIKARIPGQRHQARLAVDALRAYLDGIA